MPLEKEATVSEKRVGEIIEEVKKEMISDHEIYKPLFKELIKHITKFKPDTLFFLDRSARPIWWMVKAYYKKLGITPPFSVKFLSVSEYEQENLETLTDELSKYQINDYEKILIIDEFSESKEGHRNIDFAQKVLTQIKDNLKIEKHIFMDRNKSGMMPALYSVPNDKEKNVLYGISDTLPDSHISKKYNRSINYKMIMKYRKIFENFGERMAPIRFKRLRKLINIIMKHL